jgi:hypothetical protein
LVAHRDDVTSMLRLTTVVVTAMVVLLLGYAVIARPRENASPLSERRRAALLRYAAPTLLVIAAIGVLQRRSGRSAELFATAEWQQASLDDVRVTALATVAWWCACFVVAALAVTATFRRRAARRPTGRRRRILFGCFTVLLVGAVAVVQMIHPFTVGSGVTNAGPSTAPLAELTGTPVYDFDLPQRPQDAQVVAGGPGFIRLADDRIEGVDGTTGQTSWSFSGPDLSLDTLAISSRGNDGVAVVKASYRYSSVLIGLDATTGAPLWTYPGDFTLETDRFSPPQLSEAVTVATTRVAATPEVKSHKHSIVLSSRTGSYLWALNSGSCDSGIRVTKDTVVRPYCGGDSVGDVNGALEPGTHELRLSTRVLDVDDTVFDREPFIVANPETNLVIATFITREPPLLTTGRIVDALTGEVTNVLPEDTSAYFADTTSLILTGPDTQSIWDLATNTTIATGVPASGHARVVDGPGEAWARVGPQWVTFLPRRGHTGQPELNVFDTGGFARSVPSPCGQIEGTPRVLAVLGALLVNCGDRIVALQ